MYTAVSKVWMFCHNSVYMCFFSSQYFIKPHIQDSICHFMVYAHTAVNDLSAKYHQNERQYNYTTPKSFLEQITLYKIFLEKKREQISKRMEHLMNGIKKLKTTASQVSCHIKKDTHIISLCDPSAHTSSLFLRKLFCFQSYTIIAANCIYKCLNTFFH